MKRTRILALLLTMVVVTGVVFGAAGCKRNEKETTTKSAAVLQTTAGRKTAADLLGTSETETEAATQKETSRSTERVTPSVTKGVLATGTKTSVSEAKTAAASNGLFQVSQDYKNAHDYAIAVNTAQNIVIIYKKGTDGNFTVPFKAMTCSAGRSGHETPSGQYTTLAKQRWLYLIDGTYGQYCTKFKEHYWFHSVPYYTQDPSNLEWPEYNKLGNNASAGCVRLCVRDVKWLYDNVSLGTVVRVYSSSAAEPLAKPATIKIDTSDSNPKRGWDPTDPDAANPYH